MENHNIELKPAPRTKLNNFYIVSKGPQREPDSPQLLPDGKSMKMAEGDSISFVDVDVWSKGVFLEDTTVEGPLVFAHEPSADLEKVARRHYSELHFIGLFFGTMSIVFSLMYCGLGYAVTSATLARANQEAGEGLWVVLGGIFGIFVLIGIISIWSAIRCYRRIAAAPAKYMRDRDLGRTFKVFLPKEMSVQGAA